MSHHTAGDPRHNAVSSDPPGPGDPSSEQREVGVGPWPGGPETWPADPRLDPELLAHGDRRNVQDHYRYWKVEEIVADLDTHRHSLEIAVENLAHDLNIGSIVRTANAFNLAAVHVVGRRRWNRRGAMVTDRYLHVHHHPAPGDLAAYAAERGLRLIGVDLIPGSRPVERTELPRNALLVFGQESAGLSDDLIAACEQVVHITQYGSTRSMNVAAAAAIVMHQWMLRWALPMDPHVPPAP